jgi:hypothetical protein
MTEFCGSRVCASRIQFWLMIPEDTAISEPCPQCIEALAELLKVGDVRTMRGIHLALTAVTADA